MSENITKLREAIRAERMANLTTRTAAFRAGSQTETEWALAAVEQEIAALEAERDEFKKRPTYKEVTRAIWEGAPMGLDGNGIRIEVARNVDKLFNGKAHQ